MARCAARTCRTTGDPSRPGRRDPPHRPGHRRRLPDNPLRRQRRRATRGASSPTGCATRSGSPCGPAPTRSGSATSAGTPGRRSTGSPTRHEPVENFGWPCYEGAGRQSERLRQPQPQPLREPLRRRPARPYVARTTPTTTARRSCPARRCPTGSSSIAGLAFYPAAGPYPADYDGALFFADYSRDCIWAMLAGANGLPDPSTRRRSWPRPPTRSTSQVGPGGDLFYVGLRRRHDPAHPLLQRQPAADRRRHGQPDQRRGAADGRVRRQRSSDPDGDALDLRVGPRRRRRVRRLDRRAADVHVHPAGHLHRPGCG